MTINIDIEYVKRIEEKNYKLQNELINQQIKEYDNNKYIDKLQSNINIHFAETFQLQKENTQLKKQIDNFYYQQSKLKKTDFYIKALKNQLFNAYLKQQQQERLISELKTVLSSYNNFVDEMFPD